MKIRTYHFTRTCLEKIIAPRVYVRQRIPQKRIPIKDRRRLPWSGGVIQDDADSVISKFKINRYVRKRHVYIRQFTAIYGYFREFTPIYANINLFCSFFLRQQLSPRKIVCIKSKDLVWKTSTSCKAPPKLI